MLVVFVHILVIPIAHAQPFEFLQCTTSFYIQLVESGTRVLLVNMCNDDLCIFKLWFIWNYPSFSKLNYWDFFQKGLQTKHKRTLDMFHNKRWMPSKYEYYYLKNTQICCFFLFSRSEPMPIGNRVKFKRWKHDLVETQQETTEHIEVAHKSFRGSSCREQ